MTKFPHIPLADDSTPDNPRSYWDRLMMEDEARQQAKARAAATARQPLPAARTKLPQPDSITNFRVTTMAATQAFMHGNRTISPETVMGVRRPEFGPRGTEVGERLRAQLGIRMENGQAIYRPTVEQKQFLKEQLAARGKPTKQVDDLKFVNALDKEANFFTRFSYNHGDADAVTQGNTVSVKPEKFLDYAGFQTPDPFEEINHSSDFASDGTVGFYPPYLLNAVGGLLSSGDYYDGSVSEAFPKGAAKQMYQAYRRRTPKEQR